MDGADPKEIEAAADALVKKGSSVRSAVEKAYAKAGSDKKVRYEDVLLRLDAGTDAAEAVFGSLSLSISEAALTQEITPDGKAALRVKVVFSGNTIAEKAEVATLVKGTVYTPKAKMGLLVKGAKGESFARTFDPMTPKMFEYGAVLPPRYSPGTRAVFAFDVEVEVEKDGKKQVVSKTIRSPIVVIGK